MRFIQNRVIHWTDDVNKYCLCVSKTNSIRIWYKKNVNYYYFFLNTDCLKKTILPVYRNVCIFFKNSVQHFWWWSKTNFLRKLFRWYNHNDIQWSIFWGQLTNADLLIKQQNCVNISIIHLWIHLLCVYLIEDQFDICIKYGLRWNFNWPMGYEGHKINYGVVWCPTTSG